MIITHTIDSTFDLHVPLLISGRRRLSSRPGQFGPLTYQETLLFWLRFKLRMVGQEREVGDDVEERRCGPVMEWGKAVEVPELG